MNEDTATAPIAFTMGDAETAAGSLTVCGTSSNTTLVPNANIVFGGSGANRTVTVTPAANQAGTATITVTVSDGTLTTVDTFLLTVTAVNDAPTISNVGAQTTSVGVGVGPLSLTVGDVETPAGSLTLSGSTTNPTLVPVGNIVLGGAGTARTVTVTPAAGQSGTVTITLTVSDGGATSATSFLLTVTAPPAVVAVDAVGPGPGGAAVATGASMSWSHTVSTTGVNRLLTVGVAVGRISDTGLSLAVTYNGVPLTSAGLVHSNHGTDGFVQLFYLTAPATGTHPVQVTLLGGTATIAGGSVT